MSAALLAVGIAIVFQRVNWREMMSVWTKLDPKLFALACFLYWLQYPINALRFQRVILWATGRPPADTPSFRFLLKLTCSSGFVAAAAPIGFVSDAAKIAALRLFGSLSMTEASRSTLFDRVVGVQWLCLIGLAALPFQHAAGIGPEILLPQVLVYATVILGIGAVLALPAVLNRLRHNLLDRFALVFAGYRSLLPPSRLAIQALIISLNLILAGSALYLLFLAAGSNVSAWSVAAFISLLQLVNGLPFLYMGWGGREIAMASTLGAASNLTMNETLAISIAWGVVLIITGVANGAFMIGAWQSRVPAANNSGINRRTT